MLTNHHCHSEFCDGKASAARMAAEAHALGFAILGFSSHAPLPFLTEWTMDAARLGDYADTIRALSREYSPSMEILLGLEIDYIEGLCGPADRRFASVDLDFSIGSVHHLRPEALGDQGVGDEPLATVDGPQEGFDALIARGYGGDGLAMAEDYYRTLADCIAHGGFDILGHFDLVRKNNPGQSRFSERDGRYKDAAMAAVDALEGSGIIVEINTGGMARGKTSSPYPEGWILKEMKARNIEVCVNSDAHAPDHLLAHRAAGLTAAADAGYRELCVITKQGRRRVAL
jgi:histidinol-phosphatase (PHP family)